MYFDLKPAILCEYGVAICVRYAYERLKTKRFELKFEER